MSLGAFAGGGCGSGERRPSMSLGAFAGGDGGSGERRPSFSFKSSINNSFDRRGSLSSNAGERRGSFSLNGDRRNSFLGRRGSIGGPRTQNAMMEKKRPINGKKAILLVPDSAIQYAAMFILKFTDVQNRPVQVCHQHQHQFDVIKKEIQRILAEDKDGALYGYVGNPKNWFDGHRLSNAVGCLTEAAFLRTLDIHEAHGIVAFANRGGNSSPYTQKDSSAYVDAECILIGCALEQVLDEPINTNTFEEEEGIDEEAEQGEGKALLLHVEIVYLLKQRLRIKYLSCTNLQTSRTSGSFGNTTQKEVTLRTTMVQT